jgi:hypothetical protein
VKKTLAELKLKGFQWFTNRPRLKRRTATEARAEIRTEAVKEPQPATRGATQTPATQSTQSAQAPVPKKVP